MLHRIHEGCLLRVLTSSARAGGLLLLGAEENEAIKRETYHLLHLHTIQFFILSHQESAEQHSLSSHQCLL